MIASLDCGNDSWNGEGYAEVNCIYWRKRDGSKGKAVSDKVHDEALAYDDHFSCLVEQVLDDHLLNQEVNE